MEKAKSFTMAVSFVLPGEALGTILTLVACSMGLVQLLLFERNARSEGKLKPSEIVSEFIFSFSSSEDYPTNPKVSSVGAKSEELT